MSPAPDGRALEGPPPEVTICLFTRNRKGYLQLAIEAALAQVFTAFELLIMDNASEDGTEAMVRSIRDPRLRYHRHPFNRMPPLSYCLALRKARGRFILLAHDDDVMGPDLVRREVEAFRAHPGLTAVTTNVSVIDEHGRTLAERRSPAAQDRVWPRGAYLHAWNTEHFWLPFPTLMIRRPLLRRLFNPENWESVGCLADIYTLARLNVAGPVAFLAEPLLAYRQHAQQAQFRFDPIEAPTCLHRKLAGMLGGPQLRKYVPMALLVLLKYRLQQIILATREPLGEFRRLPRRMREELQRHARRSRRARHQGASRRHDPETRALEEEFRRSPWGPQLAICGILIGAGEPDLGLWDMAQETGFHRWLALLRSGGHLCAGLRERGIRKVAVLGSLFNAALVALDAVRSGVQVVTFLDSNQLRCRKRLAQVPVNPPQWLADHALDVDAVLVSSETTSAERIIRMLETHLPPSRQLPMFSWQTLPPRT